MNYNLLEEEWLPVLCKSGKFRRVGIIEALAQAHLIRQIAASNPMDRVAILRFLLALLYWCQGKVDDMNALPGGLIPEGWISFLKNHKDLFDFDQWGGKNRFNLEPDIEAAAKLFHDLPSGTNIAHFRHVRDFYDGLCLACCAMGLLRWSAFATASKKGKHAQMTACIHGNRPAYSIRDGANLLETLWLNWPTSSPVNDDAPVWEEADKNSSPGFLKGMTWRSRRILLAPPDAQGNRIFSAGLCCYCGEPTKHLVKEIIFHPGWERPSKEPWWDDPYLLRVENKDKKEKVNKIAPYLPGPNDALEDHAATWRSVLQGLLQYLVVNHADSSKFHITLVGTSQELYKHAETLVTSMPSLAPNAIQGLLKELEWLKEVTGKTTSARTREWERKPKGHVVIDALCSPAAKGQALRSGLCASSFLAEKELERAFERLIQKLATADPADTDAHAQLLKNWRERVCEIILRNVRKVVDFTATGSPLRRREARHQVNEAIRELSLKKGGK
ncbi:MAG: type I-E CRISPR-associated protein Cse1/CasA [Thermodesulfobacteriota bacterium]